MANRCFRAAIVAVAAAAAAGPARADVAAADGAYAQLLLRYVTSVGVRYDAWRAAGSDVKRLSEVLMAYRSADLGGMTPRAREALLVNLYNAKVLEIVLQARPSRSIRDLSRGVGGDEIFSRKILQLEGKGASLNDIEARLREEFKDPRIHFALCGASRSCPPLRAEPYLADSLDEQLDEAVRDTLARPGEVRIERHGGKTTLTVSKIFDWYAKEFETAGGVPAFLVIFAPKDAADGAAEDHVRVEFADYDWSLNAVR